MIISIKEKISSFVLGQRLQTYTFASRTFRKSQEQIMLTHLNNLHNNELNTTL